MWNFEVEILNYYSLVKHNPGIFVLFTILKKKKQLSV